MFDGLTNRLSGILERLRKRGALGESDVSEALREVRVALLEADVALPVVKDFIERVRGRAIGQDVVRSVTPGQMVVKIVHDCLVETLGTGDHALNLNAEPPAVILMVGLQGSGKTTTSAKLGQMLAKRDRKKVLLASLDIHRPAAQHQLEILAKQAELGALPIVPGEQPLAIAKRALTMGRLQGFDVVILDTAGRLHIDVPLMAEVAGVREATNPTEVLLVADAMTGQDAVTIAKEFNDKVGVTGIVLTRVDGDARGGAALSMRAVSGKPIKLLGTGEKLDALEPFHPDRLAGRILGMGDIVSLVEKAAQTVEREDAEAMARKMMKGQFNLDDLLDQLRQVKKMGDLEGLMGMLPGVGKIKQQLAQANVNPKMVGRQEAIILSMTGKERKNPKLLNGSRRKRIADGSGTTVPEVNRLLKQFAEMETMMKKIGKMGKKGLMRGALGALPFGPKPPLPPFR